MNVLNLNLWKTGLLAGMVLAVLLQAGTAGATTRTVTTTSDGGAGSLRQTILDSAKDDTINFGVTGTITLTSGELVIGRNLTITGPGANVLAVSGNNASRVLNISAGITVNMSDLAIANGRVVGASGAYNGNASGADSQGGGILNLGTLNLNNCTLKNNFVAGGNGSDDSYVDGGAGGAGSGGGIANLGTLNLAGSSLINNSATGGGGGLTGTKPGVAGNGGGGNGGGIWNQGTLNLANSTFSNNSATGGGGGEGYNNAKGGDGGGGYGGGLALLTSGTMVNCTFSGNSTTGGRGNYSEFGGGGGGAGGGAYGGGVWAGFSGSSLNTIIANNSVTGGLGGAGSPGGVYGSAIGPDVDVAIVSQGHNLIGRTDGSSGWVASDLLGGTSDATRLDPQLGPLQDNGGPTFTMALLPTSAAIDTGDDAVLSSPYNLTADQRGRRRNSGAHVDIGACEVSPPPQVTNTNDSGAGSLRDAVLVAAPGDPINFSPNVTGTIPLTSGELVFGKNVTINGPGAKVLTISGDNASRVFHITGGTCQLSNLRIANGHTSGGGGGILLDSGSLSLNNCAVAGCYAAGDGGATGGGGILSLGSTTLSLVGSTLSGNSSPDYGGGLYLFNGASATLVNSTVSGNSTLDNSSDGGGGGIYVINGSTLNVTDSTIANNSSATAGGGVYKGFNGTATFRNSLIAGNSAPGGPDCKGPFVSAGYNLIGNSTGSTGFGSTGDQLNLSPMIGPLADNGGPTFTHALLTGSPAIDKGKSFGVTTDQRGSARPYDFSFANAAGGDGSDIGAFEVQAPSGPQLTATRSGNGVVIAWPSPSTGFVLQQNASGVGSANWSTVLISPNDDGTTKTVIVTPPTGNRFYRLKQ